MLSQGFYRAKEVRIKKSEGIATVVELIDSNFELRILTPARAGTPQRGIPTQVKSRLPAVTHVIIHIQNIEPR